MGRLLPDSLTWRFALLLAAALIAANVVAGVLLSTQRQRLDDAAREAREIERITSLVPALEAVSRSAWRAIERDASTRFSRIRITESPVVERCPLAGTGATHHGGAAGAQRCRGGGGPFEMVQFPQAGRRQA